MQTVARALDSLLGKKLQPAPDSPPSHILLHDRVAVVQQKVLPDRIVASL